MPYILKNNNLEIHIDLPLENYNFSRFDWTGKITKVLFNKIPVTGAESIDYENEDQLGKGLYNEFGIDQAIGFADIKKGDWFQKIGVGLLKKTDDDYLFNKAYEIDAADFAVKQYTNEFSIECNSRARSGYAYRLIKTFKLKENSFTIHYSLQNRGEKEIVTSEYVHNFMAINKDLIGQPYKLKFPFLLNPELFESNVNPEEKVQIEINEFRFNGIPSDQFFFSYINGPRSVNASWELHNTKCGIGISEAGDFQTNKINLWGCAHVISPELFFDIQLKAGESTEWKRIYQVFDLNS